jgi:protein-S-isoprenylcysteine O-methyltransferase Ste14
MRILNGVVALVLFFELPIPVFWLILHPQIGFGRRHLRAGLWFAGLAAWGAAGVFIGAFYHQLLASQRAPFWAIAAGLVLIAAEFYLLWRVEKELGSARLVGHTELKGGGELATSGIYARMRHPRYTGMMISMLGLCLIGWTRLLWVVTGAWWLAAMTAIFFEERELRARFGPAYAEYAKRVPRFLPLHFHSRAG